MAADDLNFHSGFQDELTFNTSELMTGSIQPEAYPVQDAIGQQQIMMVSGIDQQVAIEPRQIRTIQQPVQQQLQMATQPLQTAVLDHSGQFLISQSVTPVTVVQSTRDTSVIQSQQLIPQQVRIQPKPQPSIAVVSSQSDMPPNTTQGRRTIIVQAQPAPPAPDVVAKAAVPVRTTGRRVGKVGVVTQRKKKDPNAPAPVLTAYRSFFKDTSQSVKTHNPAAKFGDVSRIVASMWEAMPDEEKAVYRKKSEEDKIRFQREMEEYKLRLESQDSGAEPVEPAEASLDTSGSSIASDHVEPMAEAATPAITTTATVSSVTLTTPAEAVVENVNLCIRKDCKNQAVRNPEWEDEYCSNECVVKHCTNVFDDWVLQNKDVAVS